MSECFCVDSKYGLTLTGVADKADYISMVGVGVYTLGTFDYDKLIIGKVSIRFYKGDQIGMVLSDDIDFIDVLNGFNEYDAEVLFITNPRLFFGMTQYSIIFLTDYSKEEKEADFTAVGVFNNSVEAKKHDKRVKRVMESMINTVQEILMHEKVTT